MGIRFEPIEGLLLSTQESGISGTGHAVGGTVLPVFAYEESGTVYTIQLFPGADLTGFTAGATVKLSLSNAEGAIVSSVISAVDDTAKKLTLTASIYDTEIKSTSQIGVEKRTVSNYQTGTWTDAPSKYRVTFSGASTDEELWKGRAIYTRAGTALPAANSIAGIVGNYIYLTAAAAGCNGIYCGPSNALISNGVLDSALCEFVSGENNFVAGEAASGFGAYNVVSGTAASAFGSLNVVNGDYAMARGDANEVTGSASSAVGVSNKVADSMSQAYGNSNKLLYQGQMAFGDFNVMTGVNAFAVGSHNKLHGYGDMAFGIGNTVTGKNAKVIGERNTVAAEQVIVIGRYADTAAAANNKGAVIISGGSYQDHGDVIAVRSLKEVDGTEVTAFRSTWRGQFRPVTQEVTVSGTAGSLTLDPERFARYNLVGDGSLALVASENFEDGDRVEIALDSSAVTLSFPAAWITRRGVTLTPAGLYVIEVEKVKTVIFYEIKFGQPTA